MLNTIPPMSYFIAATALLADKGQIQCHLFAFKHAVMSRKLYREVMEIAATANNLVWNEI